MARQLNDIPESCEGVKVIRDLRKMFPTAVLAGGYLRDLMLGRTPKDIDVLVSFDEFDLFNAQCGSMAEKGFVRTNDLSYTTSEICELWEYDNEHGELPVQIIVLQPDLDPAVRALAVDFGLCQISHDGWAVNVSALFASDCAGTFTLDRCASAAEYERSMRRYDRLKEKYPDFRLVVPARFQHFNSVDGETLTAQAELFE